MTTFHAAEHTTPQAPAQPVVLTKRVMRTERASWLTSALPAAVSVALLTALAAVIALGFRELVQLASAAMGG